MGNTMSGVIRIIVAALMAISFYFDLQRLPLISLYQTASPATKVLAIAVVLCVVVMIIYLIMNSLREFRHQHINFKGLYLIYALFILTATGFFIYDFSIKIWSVNVVVLLGYLIINLYFVITDFRKLFIHRSYPR